MHRAQPFEFQLDALVIVVVDVVVDAVFQAFDALEAIGMKEFGFEDGKEAFHGGVVEAIQPAQYAFHQVEDRPCGCASVIPLSFIRQNSINCSEVIGRARA